MAEDQGVNGNIWNDEASILLKRLGWKQVGDSNIDIENEDGQKHGIDRMFVFPDARRNKNNSQGIFVEAKCYKTTSFSQSALQSWITVLDKKLSKIKSSKKFYETYPQLSDSVLSNGLIVIWFSDTEQYSNFKDKFRDMLLKIKIPYRTSSKTPNNIYVMDNTIILRLASVINTIESFNNFNKCDVKFYYPSSDYSNNAIERNKMLSIDYMYSKYILAEAIINKIDHKIVFYFGDLSINAFKRLKSFLQSTSFIDSDKPLTIFRYARDQEFRKIISNVEELFTEANIRLTMKEMDLYSDLPTFLRNQ